MKNLFAVPFFFFLTVTSAQAFDERSVAMDDIVLEDIHIEGIVQQWKFRKICLDGQTYLLIMNGNNPVGISPAFKEGKPELCRPATHKQ